MNEWTKLMDRDVHIAKKAMRDEEACVKKKTRQIGSDIRTHGANI